MSKKPTSKKTDRAFARLEEFVRFMRRHALTELGWESGTEKVHLKTPEGRTVQAREDVTADINRPAAPAMDAPARAAPVQIRPPEPAPPKPAGDDRRKTVTAPLVGTFYRASSPGAQPFVKEGSAVKKGDVLGIIEAMKVFNNIESDYNGRVVGILTENGQPVEFGKPLFVIDSVT